MTFIYGTGLMQQKEIQEWIDKLKDSLDIKGQLSFIQGETQRAEKEYSRKQNDGYSNELSQNMSEAVWRMYDAIMQTLQSIADNKPICNDKALPLNIETAKCLECGEDYIVKSKKRKFCSNACKAKNFRKNNQTPKI